MKNASKKEKKEAGKHLNDVLDAKHKHLTERHGYKKHLDSVNFLAHGSDSFIYKRFPGVVIGKTSKDKIGDTWIEISVPKNDKKVLDDVREFIRSNRSKEEYAKNAIEEITESINNIKASIVNELNNNTNINKSTDNDSEKMAKKKNVEGKAKGVTLATQMVKSKARYENFAKVTKSLTVGKNKITGDEAQNLYYSRKYSRLGTAISEGNDAQHDAAIDILKAYQKLSGPEQTKQAQKTLDSILAAYNKGKSGGGGRSKLGDDDKVSFDDLF